MIVGCTKPNHCVDTKKMPKSAAFYTEAPRLGQIEGIIEDQLHRADMDAELANFEMTQRMPEGLALVPDSAQPAPEIEDIDGQIHLRWTWSDEAATGPHTVTYRVEPIEEGVWELGGELSFLDVSDLSRTLPMPVQPLTVSGVCEPEETPPTPTFTPEPATPTFTPEPATETPVPATPTPRPEPIYIPVTLNEERCVEDALLGDFALVIDMSSSMERLTEDGVPKKQAVFEAATAFVDRLDLTPNDRDQHDQVAVVGFNESAWIQQPLGNDAAAASSAISALETRIAHGSRLDLALNVGVEALAEELRKPGNTPVIILLTDGVPSDVPPDPDTGRPEDTVVAAAQAAKDAGITVYTIGFGSMDPAADPADQVNADLLRDCATDPTKAYIDPSAEGLMKIYGEIADVFTCPGGRHDWSRAWP